MQLIILEKSIIIIELYLSQPFESNTWILSFIQIYTTITQSGIRFCPVYNFELIFWTIIVAKMLKVLKNNNEKKEQGMNQILQAKNEQFEIFSYEETWYPWETMRHAYSIYSKKKNKIDTFSIRTSKGIGILKIQNAKTNPIAFRWDKKRNQHLMHHGSSKNTW